MKRRLAQLAVGLLLLVLPGVLLRIDATRALIGDFLAYLRAAGALGVVVFLGVDVVAALIAMPTWVMSGVAGYVWGFRLGVLVALPALTTVSCVCFLLSRRFLTTWLRPAPVEPGKPDGRVERTLRAVQGAVVGNGLKVTFLLRLTFVLPQNLMGYMLGATPLRFRDFAAGTFLGLLPLTLVHVYVGTVVVDLAAFLSGDTGMSTPLAVAVVAGGFVLAGVALYVVGRLARRALDRTLDAPPEQLAAEPSP